MRSTEPRQVRTMRVTTQRWEDAIELPGEVAASEDAVLAAKAPGRVVEIAVDVGSRARAGELLVRTDATDAELRVQQAEAAVRAARTLLGLPGDGAEDTISAESSAAVKIATVQRDEAARRRERARALSNGGAGSQADLDAAETDFRAAESRLQDALEQFENRRAVLAQRRADLASARQAVVDTRLLAPFDGAVAERFVDHGEYVSTGAPMVRWVQDERLELRFRIPEQSAARLRVGTVVRASVVGLDVPVSAHIDRLAPALDARSRSILAECDLNADRSELRPGSFARVQVVRDADAVALSVPAEALVEFAGIARVHVVEGKTAREHRVTTGRRADGRVEIIEGLRAGDQVVLSPGNLRDGDAVNAVE